VGGVTFQRAFLATTDELNLASIRRGRGMVTHASSNRVMSAAEDIMFGSMVGAEVCWG